MAVTRYLDFDLALERAAGGYRIALRSPAGEFEAGLADTGGAVSASSIPEAGAHLFAGLFSQPVLERYQRSLQLARSERAGLRIRLALEGAPELAALPWETLFDPDLGEFLVQSEELLLVRHLPRRKTRPPLAVEPPLRLLVVMPEPADRPVPGAGALYASLEEALAGPVREGLLVIERLSPATQAALQSEFEERTVHLLQFIGHGDFRQRARYGKLILEGRGGGSRAVSAELMGRLLASHQSLRLAVLSEAGTAMPARATGDSFLGVAMETVSAGVPAAISMPVVWEEGLSSHPLRSIYQGLARAEPVDVSAAAAARQIVGNVGGSGWGIPALFTATAAGGLFELGATATVRAAEAPQPRPAAAVRPPEPSPEESLLARKVAAGTFDVFLSYNRSDGRAVKEIGRRLKERGLLPWLDEWELRPGYSWQALLEEQIGRIHSAALFVGEDGLGPWQRREMEAFLNEFVERRCPVIPVLLPTAPARPKLPIFLKGLTWVDFRRTDPEPLERLIWGITGEKGG